MPVRNKGMEDPNGLKASSVAAGAGVQAKNTINMMMEDLLEEDWKEIERDLEEEMAEVRRRKLACFQKMSNDVVKKSGTTAASGTKVNSHLSLEDLVHMVDVSIASKYGADLTQFTCVVAEDMRHMLNTFKQDLNSSLPRQVRALVQQINGEA
jgi:HPt (histidine-containing phosphotransfer) domain-containing protein